mmetsp:Transcript_6216/g.25187  ORF Transcript_6216/g.25187 Transcript_6216/m.25187 type:complete len:262 (-) Transcript_6216:726-1511(-)
MCVDVVIRRHQSRRRVALRVQHALPRAADQPRAVGRPRLHQHECAAGRDARPKLRDGLVRAPSDLVLVARPSSGGFRAFAGSAGSAGRVELAEGVRGDHQVEGGFGVHRAQRRHRLHGAGLAPRVRLGKRPATRPGKESHALPELAEVRLVRRGLRDATREAHHARRRVHERRAPGAGAADAEATAEDVPRCPQRGRGSRAELQQRLRLERGTPVPQLAEHAPLRAEGHGQARHGVRRSLQGAVRRRGRRAPLLRLPSLVS